MEDILKYMALILINVLINLYWKRRRKSIVNRIAGDQPLRIEITFLKISNQ